MRHLVRDFGTCCAKCLLDRYDAVHANVYKCARGTSHTDANTWAVVNEARYCLSSEDCAAIYVHRAKILEFKKANKAAFSRLQSPGGSGSSSG